MTDCQDPEMEQGSNLPLPPGIDGEETNEPQVESELESPSTLAEKVLAEAQQALADSCDVSRGDYLFGGPDLDPEIENGHAGSEGEVDGRRIMDEIPALRLDSLTLSIAWLRRLRLVPTSATG